MMVKHTERDGIDEQEIIASFLPDEPTDHNALVHAAKQVDEIRPSSSEVPAAPVGEPRRRKSREQDYEKLFIHESSVTARTGKMVYIRTEFHDTIQRITQVTLAIGIHRQCVGTSFRHLRSGNHPII